MPFFILLIAIVAPRIGIALLWLFTDFFRGVFGSKIWPVVGFLFMPVTMLWYAFVEKFLSGQWGLLAWAGLVVAVLVDVGAIGTSRDSYRARLR